MLQIQNLKMSLFSLISNTKWKKLL